MKEYYDMIFKRKSVRKFDPKLKLTESDLDMIRAKINALIPLIDDISVDYKILPREDTNAKWGEYCLLFYSEERSNYLQNAGYMLEQLDLYLASLNIGGCWYGWGKTKETVAGGESFVIMYAFGKSSPEDFNEKASTVKRHPLETIWQGELALDAAEAARYAPSACNSQPWRVVCGENEIKLYRSKKSDIKARLVSKLSSYFNVIDIGIYMCILECALEHHGYSFSRELAEDIDEGDNILTAVYKLDARDR